MEFIIALCAAVNWVRVILMLHLTRSFGPMITIFERMIGDFTTFFVLWVLMLLTISCFGYIMFNELSAYDNLYKVLIVHF
jgi:hypothetical protein